MTNWEKEKAYRARRADELKEDMAEAIRCKQDSEFKRLFKVSGGYLKRKEQAQIMREYVESRRA